MNINSCFHISGLTGPAEAASARGDRRLGFKDSACLGAQASRASRASRTCARAPGRRGGLWGREAATRRAEQF